MADLGIGIAAIADVGRVNPATGKREYMIGGAFQHPAAWAALYVGLSVAYLAGLYFLFGGLKGDVAS